MKTISKMPAKTLANLLRSNAKMIVYDVRDSDYGEFGVIKKSINLPYFAINEGTIESVVERAKKENLDNLVCCCKFGKARSVIVASKIAEEMSKQNPIPKTEVSYLEGGIGTFVSYPENLDLINISFE